jgi:hypothetical protein
MDRRHRGLQIVMTIDGWLSFICPPVMLVVVPVLVITDAPAGMIGATVLVLAAILGLCGVVMAGVLAVDAAQGHLDFPDDVLNGLGAAGLGRMPDGPTTR